MRRILSIVLAVSLILSTSLTSYAANDQKVKENKIKEKEVIEEMKNGTAKITHEVREIDSFTEEELEQYPELKQMFEEINEISIQSINGATKYGKLYSTTVVTSAGDTVIYRSYPKVSLYVTDVGTAGSSDISSSFDVIESVNVNGDYNTGWHNAIRYKNISGGMACGENTAFTISLDVEGNTGDVFGANVEGIIELIANSTGLGSVVDMLNAIGNITYSGGKTDSRTVYGSSTGVVGAQMDDVLYSNDHYLTIDSSLSTIDSTETSNQSTDAAAEWKFDVYFFLGSL
jgi:hypothetical protein